MNQDQIIALVIKIVPILCSILSLLLTAIVLRKKNSANYSKAMLSLLSNLPAFINDAEAKGFKDGESKLIYVLQVSCSYLSSLLNMKYEQVFDTYAEQIKILVEQMLTTPQKHEKEEN